MTNEKLKTAPVTTTGAVLGLDLLASFSDRDHSLTLPEIQRRFLAARYGLAADRAQLVASLAWGRTS